MPQVVIYPVAEAVPFDPTNDPACGLTKDNLQNVIEELCNRSAAAASPGFSWGRKGTHGNGTWLKNNDVASNKTGIPFGLTNGSIKMVTICNRAVGPIFDLEIWHHTGDMLNATLLTTITTLGATTVETFNLNIAVPKGIMLATKIVNVSQGGSPRPEETQVFLVIKGSLI